MLEEYLWADYALYNHFKSIFNQKLNQFGEKEMTRELKILRQANANMKVYTNEFIIIECQCKSSSHLSVLDRADK